MVRGRQQTAVIWAAVFVVVVAAGVLALVLRSHGNAQQSSSQAASASLRLGPGHALLSHARAAAGAGASASLVAVGDYTTCVAHKSAHGGVDCWGDGAHGQLGDGTKLTSLVPAAVQHIAGAVTSISSGGSHTCATTSAHALMCWGANAHGELGTGTKVDAHAPTAVPNIGPVTAVATGTAHTCAVLAAGGVECWGSNSNGQLGSGSLAAEIDTPVAVKGLPGRAQALTAGLAHTCALLAGGTVACWGANANGELGNGTTVDSPTPVLVKGLTGPATAVAAGDAHTCALIRSGAIECWGWNIQGQLGNGGGSDSSTPVAVAGIAGARAISAGGNDTCAVLLLGAVKCWGANPDGELGNGDTSDSATPVTVSGLGGGAAAVSTGLSHSCALLTGGATTCWGANAEGELGNGTRTGSATPVQVVGFRLAPDGSGAITVSPSELPSGSKRAVLSFTFTAAEGGMHGGTVEIVVPHGWSAPSTRLGTPGGTTASKGRVTVVGRAIAVTDLTLSAAERLVVRYGSGPGARPAANGGAWNVQEQSSPNGTLVPLAKQPSVALVAADGSGTLSTKTPVLPRRPGVRILRFLYTAAGTLQDGQLVLTVPPGWSAPSTTPGYATTTEGKLSIVGREIRVTGIKLLANHTLAITYRGNPPSGDVGAQTWTAEEQSGRTGDLRPVPNAPSVRVVSPDGAGDLNVDQQTVPNGAKRVTLTLTYVAGPGGVDNGKLSFVVPPGWTAPSTKAGTPGYVSAQGLRLSTFGRTVTLLLGRLGGGASVKVTYADAHAPTGEGAEQIWTAKERSTTTGELRALARAPGVTVLSPDGSGSLARASGPVASGSHGNTIVWVFTAATGGTTNGTLRVDVPSGWSAPSTNPSDPGFVNVSPGTLVVSGRTITVSNLSLVGGNLVTITYGSRAGGGPGANAPAGSVGPATWPSSEESSTAGRLVRLTGH